MRGYKFVGAITVIASFFAMAGGASAAKLGDQAVDSRHLASGAVHCRALDKYLKGHLCGPGATIKKVGQPGPPGPPGPGGAGATEVFYVASAVTPRMQIYTGGGLTLHATCDTTNDLTLEAAADVAGGTLRSTAIGSKLDPAPIDAAVETLYEDRLLGTTATEVYSNYTEAMLTLSYVNPNGSNLTGTFQMDSETNGALNDTRDCVFAGHMIS